MNRFKVLLILMPLLTNSYAQDNSSEKKKAKRVNLNDFLLKKEKKKEYEPSTLSLSLGYQNMGTKIEHGESSDSSQFYPMGYESDISLHIMSLQINKEILANNYVSFTLMGKYGIVKGSDADTLNTENIQFEDNAKGKAYGGGMSINLNMEGLGLRIQPFFGTQFVTYDNEYNISYGQIVGDNLPINMSYANKRTALQHSIGARLMDESKSLMSFVSVDYLQEQSNDTSVFARQGSNEINITKPANFDQDNISFSLGIGYLF